MENGFLDLQNSFWLKIGKIGKMILLSLFWYLTSIPLITIPASCIAFNTQLDNCIFGDEIGLVGGYFKSFKKHFKQSIPLSVFGFVVGLLTFYESGLLIQLDGSLLIRIMWLIIIACALLSAAIMYFGIQLMTEKTTRVSEIITYSIRYFILIIPVLIVFTIALYITFYSVSTLAFLPFIPAAILWFGRLIFNRLKRRHTDEL